MQLTITPTCEALFLHAYVDDKELERIAKRLRLTPMKEPAFFTGYNNAVQVQPTTQRVCFKLHDNITIFVYGDLKNG